MNFTAFDILCCPPPLFHCFGLVLGLLAVVTHGAKIVYPGETFDPKAVLHAISDERCTALHGVPTMFEAILALPRPEKFDSTSLRTGIIAGAPVPRPLMKRLLEELNMTEFTSSYGMSLAKYLREKKNANSILQRPDGSIADVFQRIHHRHYPHASYNSWQGYAARQCQDHRCRWQHRANWAAGRALHGWLPDHQGILEQPSKNRRDHDN